MSCVPVSGGCERWATDVLIAALNDSDGSNYEYQVSLDQNDSTQAQPESLYIDPGTRRQLVVERKVLPSPSSFVHDHVLDHALAGAISRELADFEFPNVFFLRTLSRGSGSRLKIDRLVGQIAGAIRFHTAKLEDGNPVEIAVEGYGFELGLMPSYEREPGDPVRGLKFSWPSSSTPLAAAKDLHDQLDKIYESCARKFSNYSSARRILMLEPCGVLEFTDVRWWSTVLEVHSPMPIVEEIWISWHWPDEGGHEVWDITRAFPRHRR